MTNTIRDTNFIIWLPERPPKIPTNKACNHEPIKNRLTTDSKPKSIVPPVAEKNSEDNSQPRRSSCTLPATSAASMATMIEQKLVNAVSSYEPLVLTQCKFEPTAKLMPESCF
ncbi:Histone-lysine N-methyltransferase SETD1B [Abeliophyllum distichum]|uniref:Histone-lysine N-methyltransferase SETD1B n=1 Tax=Abeliophyllum distichum TaxID=126358 RepID=A0ABD1P0V0_9LAMI